MSEKSTDSKTEEVPPNPFFQKKKVVHRIDTEEVSIRLFVEPSTIEGAPVLIGFPNIGLTPVLTSNYLVEELDLALIGTIAPEDMASTAVVSHKGQPCHAIRIFGDKRIVIICSELKIPDKLINSLSASLVDFCSQMKTSMIWCAEGVPVEKVDQIEREELQYLTTCSTMGDKLSSSGHTVLHDAVLAGVTGGIVSEVVDCGTPINLTCLLAPTSSFYPDAWASVMVIRVLDSMYETWESDTTRLEKSASKLEKTVKKMMSNNLRRSQGSSYHNSMYN